MAIADRGGLPGLTIRSLAKELGAKPMSVYLLLRRQQGRAA
jgi:hypothetical protein